jgi:inner membrane protein
LVSGRLHGEHTRRRRLLFLLTFPVLAMLPDIDVLWVSLGAPDAGAIGHRGFTHTPLFALFVGALAALLNGGCRRARLRFAGMVTLAVASHGVLDALAQDGRGILLAWPFWDERFHFPWRPLPDAPVGVAFFSQLGLDSLATEVLYFLPMVAYALWPRRWRRARAGPVALSSPPRSSAPRPESARAGSG